jgi:predicted methyltransferase MtxX (methanogen marker protein 4)
MDVLNDAMYSDSHAVVDSLADFIETTMQTASATVISQDRMNQVRHIIQVDEVSFKANFTAEQLKTIETKEMAAIVEEVVSSVGLQRLRFMERRNKGRVTTLI